MQELLEQGEQIVIGRSTLDRLLDAAGLRQSAAAAPVVHRRRRTRRAAEGMLLQIDGSPFDWLEGRGSQASLIGTIDDATGGVTAPVTLGGNSVQLTSEILAALTILQLHRPGAPSCSPHTPWLST